eukprot:376174-Rhodomonas_salina.3
MIGSLQEIGEEEWETSKEPETWKKLLLSLCFFHAVVQERRKYGPLGWNVRYEFNASDLTSAKQVLRMCVERFHTVPWDALSYVTGEINYGGRVTDDLDRKLLTCMLSRFYSSAVLEQANFKFSKSGLYHASRAGSYAEAMEYVLGLPSVDEPEVFGMHGNASLVFQRHATHEILDTILTIQPRVATANAGEPSPEAQVHDQAVALLKRLPQPLAEKMRSKSSGSSQPAASKGPNSYDVVRRQEIARFNLLLATMRASLAELIKAVKGVVVMSASLEAMLSSIHNSVVPELWANMAYPSLKPLSSWVRDLHARVAFFKAWTDRGAAPFVFMLPAFFFPQGLVTAMLQNHARAYSIAIDALSFKFNVRSEAPDSSAVTEAPTDGVLIEGLWLEAGRWDTRTKKLRAAREGEMLSPLPVVHFLPTLTVNLPAELGSQDAAESERSGGSKFVRTPGSSRPGSRPESASSSISKASNPAVGARRAEPFPCPLYKTSTRQGSLSTTGRSTNYILSVSLPSDEAPEVWVLQGTCLLTMTDE